MSGITKTLIFLVAFVIMVIGAFTYKVLRTNPEPDIQALIYPTPKQLPEFKMTSHTNQAFDQDNLLGKWSVVFFGFTYCPDICPTTMASLGEMETALPEDVARKTQFLFVSVDPERDTIEKLNTYVPFFNEDFTGLVGDPQQLEIFSKSLGAVYLKVPMGESYQMQHSGRIFIINPQGQRFGIFAEDHANPGQLDITTMTSDLIQIVRTNSI